MVVTLKIWVIVVVIIMIVYAVRHAIFTLSRLAWRQRPYYQDIVDGRMPSLSVLIPMHNEAVVASSILDAILACDYPNEKLEVIPIDDHSTDGTAAILQRYAAAHEHVRPLYRENGSRGKSNALNAGLAAAVNDVVIVFDADYLPARGLLRQLANAFVDPEVGAVMGRVVPFNCDRTFLTRMLAMERTGGYQVDQQARYNLDLLPQYGGTVGGFRRDIALLLDGFDPNQLAEDTDLTFKLFVRGWRVAYANRAECYEQVPESWATRFRQLRRWSRGHNHVLVRHALPLMRSEFLNLTQKLEGLLLLLVYAMPLLLLSGFAANAALFLMGAMPIWSAVWIGVFVVAYNAFGNFAPVYEIGAAEVLDGMQQRIYLLPYLFFVYIYNTWTTATGFIDALGDIVRRRALTWEKTERTATVSS